MFEIKNFVLRNKFLLLNIIKVIIVFLITYFIISILKYIINLCYKKAINTHYITDVALISAIKKPLIFLLWLFCILFSAQILNEQFKFDLYNNIYNIKIFITSIGVIWFLFNFVNQYTKRIILKKEKSKETIDYGMIDMTRKILLIVIVIVILFIAMDYLGVKVKALLTIGGIGGLAIGWAAKEFLSNLFGGFSIFMDKPFTVGDWIASPDRDIEGSVEQIGWRQTRILTFANYPIYLPNYLFSEIIIENKGKMKSRRIDEKIGIRYCDFEKLEKIVKEIKEMLLSHPEVHQKSTTVVAFEKVNKASLDIRIYCFTNTTSYVNYSPVKQDILLKAINIIKANGAEIEYEDTARFLEINGVVKK